MQPSNKNNFVKYYIKNGNLVSIWNKGYLVSILDIFFVGKQTQIILKHYQDIEDYVFDSAVG